MSTRSRKIIAATLTLAGVAVAMPNALADVTSPGIKDKGRKYTIEKPQTEYYGNGPAGRMTEASELRFQAETLLNSGEYEKAIPVAKKAVQFDAGDPGGHLLLARALTQKFYQQKGTIDEKLLTECLREWQLIRYHDADPTEQFEAGNAAKRLIRIAKALEKDKKERQRIEDEKLAAELLAKGVKIDDKKTRIAGSRDVAGKKLSAEEERNEAAKADQLEKGTGDISPELKQLTQPRRRFMIF